AADLPFALKGFQRRLQHAQLAFELGVTSCRVPLGIVFGELLVGLLLPRSEAGFSFLGCRLPGRVLLSNPDALAFHLDALALDFLIFRLPRLFGLAVGVAQDDAAPTLGHANPRLARPVALVGMPLVGAGLGH